MSDKSIGIKLDVRQTGLQQTDESLSKISKNIASLTDSVSKENTKGWGSASQTKEMREQLRYLQQIAEIQTRIARMQNPNNTSSPSAAGQGSLPSRSSGAGSGSSSGNREMSELTSMLGKVGSAIAGLSLLGTIISSLGRSDQLSAGYGNINKRMGGSTNGGLDYAKSMTGGLNGNGYDDLQTLQAATSYSSVTGRMNPNDLKSQMKTILDTSRRFGMTDPSATTSSFSSAFSSGVTGGSGAQMNPQEFANLLANAIASGRMEGKEGKMLEQIAQVTQMSVQSMGKAGDERTIAAFLAMGNRTGNQAMMNKLPDMISGINQGIASPSGGYGAQALTMRAIGGGKMDYWKEQFIQSQGAFGTDVDKDGKAVGATNIEKVTNQLMKTFGGDKYKTAMMVAQQFNMKPADAMNYINTYTKDGKFDSTMLDQYKASTMDTPKSIPTTDTDRYTQDQINKQNQADKTALGVVPIRSGISGAVGDMLGSPVGTGLLAGGIGLSAIGGLYNAYKMARGATRFGARVLGGGSKAISTGAAATTEAMTAAASESAVVGEALPPRSTKADAGLKGLKGMSKSLLRKLGLAGAIGMGVYNVATSDDKPRAIVEEGSGMAGAWAGAETGAVAGAWTGGAIGSIVPGLGTAIGAGVGGFIGGAVGGAVGYWGGKKIGSGIYGNKTPAATASASSSDVYGPPAPNASTASTGQLTGSELVPVVISTILALQPYMGQIRGLLGDSSGRASNVPYNPAINPQTSHAFNGIPTPNSSGLTLANASTPSGTKKAWGSKATSGGSTKATSGSFNKSSATDAISYYAQQYGVPEYVAYAIAMAESSLNPGDTFAEANGTTSTGLFALNSNGQGKGYSDEQLKDPMTNSKIGLGEISKAYKKAKANGVPEGAGMAQWVAENSGHPGYGVHSELDDKIRNNAQGLLDGKIKIDGGSITVNIKTDDGSVQQAKAPITAEYHGLSA